jgi:hypothetical protein
MSLKLSQGLIDSFPAQLHDQQLKKCVFEMRHGDVGYVDYEAWWVNYDKSLGIDGNAAVHTDEYIMNIVAQGKDFLLNQDEDSLPRASKLVLPFARVVCLELLAAKNNKDILPVPDEFDMEFNYRISTNEPAIEWKIPETGPACSQLHIVKGYIIDSSSHDYVSNGSSSERVERSSGPYGDNYIENRIKRMPVLGWAGNTSELELYESILGKHTYNIILGHSALVMIGVNSEADEEWSEHDDDL